MKKALATLFLSVFLLQPSAAQAWTNLDPELIEAGKKEGEIVYYTTMTLSQSQKVVQKFEAKYPFIKVDLFRTGGGPLLNKIHAEARGGRYAWDVVSGRGEMVLPLLQDKLLAPYRSPESKFISQDLVDQENYWTAYYVNPYVLGYNTRWVKKEKVPKSYEELLDSKWKGKKISLDDEAYGLLSGLIRAWGKERAVSYVKKLAAQEPVLMRGNTNRVQLTLAGEYALIIAYAPTIQRETSRGSSHRLGSSRARASASQSGNAGCQGAASKRQQAFHRLSSFQRGAENARGFQAHTGPQ